ncbi:class I SAM-dependent methyltransferase [Saccharopolyspora spinosporotrichia]
MSRAPCPAVRADALYLPFADGTFDCAAALWMLYHLPDPLPALREARRVLRPGGLLATCTSSRFQRPRARLGAAGPGRAAELRRRERTATARRRLRPRRGPSLGRADGGDPRPRSAPPLPPGTRAFLATGRRSRAALRDSVARHQTRHARLVAQAVGRTTALPGTGASGPRNTYDLWELRGPWHVRVTVPS